MKRNPLTLIIALLLILIFGFLLFSIQVRTTEVAVVTTFGKPTRQITEPSLYFKWPWPIQKVWTFDRRVQNFEDRLTEGLTSDNFGLLTSVYVGWKVSNPTNFFPRFAGSANPISAAETLLDQWVGNAKTDVVGPGTIVLATDLATNQPESFTILGAWDSDPDRGVISYLTPIAMALLNRKVGDEVEFELHGNKRRHRIEKIEAWKIDAPATQPA